MWNIVWVSPHGYRSVSVSRHFLLQALQCPCSMRKWFSRDHCCRGRSKPGCRNPEIVQWHDWLKLLLNLLLPQIQSWLVTLQTILTLLRRCSRQREQLIVEMLSICLSVCCQNAKKTLFSQKLSNLELWFLLTNYRKSYIGFLKNQLLDP